MYTKSLITPVSPMTDKCTCGHGMIIVVAA
jgi:hypothetical protein